MGRQHVTAPVPPQHETRRMYICLDFDCQTTTTQCTRPSLADSKQGLQALLAQGATPATPHGPHTTAAYLLECLPILVSQPPVAMPAAKCMVGHEAQAGRHHEAVAHPQGVCQAPQGLAKRLHSSSNSSSRAQGTLCLHVLTSCTLGTLDAPRCGTTAPLFQNITMHEARCASQPLLAAHSMHCHCGAARHLPPKAPPADSLCSMLQHTLCLVHCCCCFCFD